MLFDSFVVETEHLKSSHSLLDWLHAREYLHQSDPLEILGSLSPLLRICLLWACMCSLATWNSLSSMALLLRSLQSLAYPGVWLHNCTSNVLKSSDLLSQDSQLCFLSHQCSKSGQTNASCSGSLRSSQNIGFTVHSFVSVLREQSWLGRFHSRLQHIESDRTGAWLCVQNTMNSPTTFVGIPFGYTLFWVLKFLMWPLTFLQRYFGPYIVVNSVSLWKSEGLKLPSPPPCWYHLFLLHFRISKGM